MSNWLKNGINFKKDADQLTRLNTVFTKRVWPIIARDGILIREYMFAVGLRQLTGLYYINSLLAKISIEPITLASPVLRSVFKFFPRFRVYNHLKDVAKIDAFMTKEGIEGLSANQTVDLAAERGIVTLGKTERTLKNNLTDWYNHKGLGLSNYFMTFINICGRSPNN